MKQCIALAGLACLLAAGCAHSGLGKKKCCESCQVARSQNAPRPQISRDHRPSSGLGIERVAYNSDASCGAGDCTSCGCPVGSCDCNGGGNGCGCDQCGGGACGRFAEGMASGYCGGGPGGGGPCGCICPNGGGYPEYPTFNQGPPVGQVAYPYYTVRGPRDFLRNNPPTIGPY